MSKNSQFSASTFAVDLDAILSLIEDLANNVLEYDNEEELKEKFECLAEYIIELEKERNELHSELEVNSINANVSRHLLKQLPKKYRKLMEDAVLAARYENEVQMKKLQKELKIARFDMKEADEKQKLLQKENLRMMPERDIVTRQHDEIIAQLNQRMAAKASKQIRLNETKDTLKETKANASEFQIGIANVNEDLEEFRTACAEEMNGLLKEVAELEEAILLQKSKTADKKKISDAVLEEIAEITGRIIEVQKEIRRMEANTSRLEVQSMQAQNRLETERQTNLKTAEEITILTSTHDRQKIKYDEEVFEWKEKNQNILEDIKKLEDEDKNLVALKEKTYTELIGHKQQKDAAHIKVKDMVKLLQSIRARTTDLVEQIGFIKQNITALQESLVVLEENHKATVDTFNAQISECQVSLNQEKIERMKVQDMKEESDRELATFHEERVKFMNSMAEKIEMGRKKHKDLVAEKSKYNDLILKNKKRIEGLIVENEINEKSFMTMKGELSMDIERIKTSIEMFKGEIVNKKKNIDEKKPFFKKLEEEVQDVGEEFTFAKNEVVAVRNKEKSLQEQLNRINLMLLRLEKPQETLRHNIKKTQAQGVEQLRTHADERKVLETEIYGTTHKIEHVLNANDKFIKANNVLNDEISEIGASVKSHKLYQDNLNMKLQDLQSTFFRLWKEGEEFEEKANKGDMAILDCIEKLQEATKKRGDKLTSIATNLQSEMQVLTGFLDNVNSRRPKDTRQSKRSSLKVIRTPSSGVTGNTISLLTGLPDLGKSTMKKSSNMLPILQTPSKIAQV